VIFFFVLAYLSCVHLYFQIYFYGSKQFDITSPMMILTQKLTYLAFSYSDGIRPENTLTQFQKTYRLKYFWLIVSKNYENETRKSGKRTVNGRNGSRRGGLKSINGKTRFSRFYCISLRSFHSLSNFNSVTFSWLLLLFIR
jgi:hypothetical protein